MVKLSLLCLKYYGILLPSTRQFALSSDPEIWMVELSPDIVAGDVLLNSH